jgi:GT2 family glycosyltransferase
LSSVAAIIVSYRSGAVLADCLASVVGAVGVSEIVIVDNGNPEREIAALDAFSAGDQRVRLLRGQGNIGFAAGSNLAAKHAHVEVLAFINPDVVLAPNALQHLAAALHHAPPPAIIGGDLRDAQGRPDRGSRRERLTLWRAWVTFTGLSRLERFAPAFRDFNRHDDPLPSQAADVGAVSGALMAVRRADFEAIGGFDEGYFLHVEDVDLCRRARDAGWRVLFEPGPHGIHHRSSSEACAASVALHKARSFRRYFVKFARGPVDRFIAEIFGLALIAALPLAAMVSGRRARG